MLPPVARRASIFLMIAALGALAACSSTTVGTGSGDGGASGASGSNGSSVPTEKNAPLGAKCHCHFSDCCAAGLYCATPDACNVQTASGCYTEGTCREKLKQGEPCEDPRECADRGASCLVSAGCFLSPSEILRCQSSIDCPDGRSCVDTYCKVMSGKQCFESGDCASGECSGGKCL